MASSGLGVALESTLLAEREIATGKLVAPLEGRSVDVCYVGHYLVFRASDSAARCAPLRVDYVGAFARGQVKKRNAVDR